MDIAIIRSKKDAIEVAKYIIENLNKDIDDEEFLITNLSNHPQYAFDIDSGIILCGVDTMNNLAVSTVFTEIEPDTDGNEDYKIYVYDTETKEILCALDHENNLQMSGNIVFDSLNNINKLK